MSQNSFAPVFFQRSDCVSSLLFDDLPSSSRFRLPPPLIFEGIFEIPAEQRERASRAELLENLKNEYFRIRTFRNFVKWYFPSWLKLAKSGFFYFNNSDFVQCVFCFGIVGNWAAHNDPDSEHRKFYPNCRFVLSNFSTAAGNVPIENESSEIIKLVKAAESQPWLLTPIRHPKLIRFFTNPPRLHQMVPLYLECPTLVLLDPYCLEELEIVEISLSWPQYISIRSRNNTFRYWPRQLCQKSEDLAASGLFYSGNDDLCRCFACDGEFRSWRNTDTDPWIRHIKARPWCSFVRLHKSSNYIFETVREKNRMSLPAAAVAVEETPSPLPQPHSWPPAPSPPTPQFHPEEVVTKAVAAALATIRNLPEQPQIEEFVIAAAVAAALATVRIPTLEDLLKCKVCLDKPIEIVMLPCAHFVTCARCTGNLKACSMCREPYKGFVKVFL